jgi:predicted TIM-barrel fold metal-dependent hydrolase
MYTIRNYAWSKTNAFGPLGEGCSEPFLNKKGFLMNDQLVDAHMHILDLKKHYYKWLTENPDLQAIADRSYLAADYEKDTADWKIARCVFVEAGLPATDYKSEVDLVRAELSSLNRPYSIVAGADLESPHFFGYLKMLANVPEVRGVRQILNWHTDSSISYRERNLLESPLWRSGFALLSEFNMSFDLQIYPGQMTAAAELAAAHSGTILILNHSGMPLFKDIENDLMEWRRGIKLLASQPNVFVKVSGFSLTAREWSTELIRPYVSELFQVFGPARCMFGSNLPVDKATDSPRRLLDALRELTEDLDTNERTAFWSGTACRVYWAEKEFGGGVREEA